MDQPATTAHSRRRWFRFSLRTMLLGVTAFCCLLAWPMRVVRERQAALQEIRDGSTFHVTTAAVWAEQFPPGNPLGPTATIPWVRTWLGDQAIQEFWYNSFNPAPSEAELRRLARLFPEASFHEIHPEPCHPGCFPHGTLVDTPQGPRPIETIRAGEIVNAVRASGEIMSVEVRTVFVTDNHVWKVSTDSGVLFTTQTQPLCLADGGTRPAGELMMGDQVLRRQEGNIHSATVLNATRTERTEKVYNLILGDKQVFIAGDFLARSKPPREVAGR